MAVDPNIKKKADDIRNKIYGKEVRESLASGLEAMSTDVVENTGRQDNVESQFQDVIENTTDKDVISAPEIIAARDGEPNLKARLDKENQEVTAQLAQTENKQNLLGWELQNKIRKIEPMVTFVDDDAYRQVLTHLKPLSEKYNIPFVVAAISDRVQKEVDYSLTGQELMELQEMGWEISGHTHTHRNLRDLSYEEQEFQLKTSKEILEGMGLDISTVCYPYGGTNDDTAEIVRKYYRAGRTTDFRNQMNHAPLQTYDLLVTPLGSWFDTWSESPYPTDSLDFYKYQVDQAIENDAWLIFMTHVGGNDQHDATQQSYLEQTIQYVKSKNIDVVTLDEGMNRRGNIVDIGRYYKRDLTKDHYVVGADGSFESNKMQNIVSVSNSATASMKPKDFQIGRITMRSFADGVDTTLYPTSTGGTLITDTSIQRLPLSDYLGYISQEYRVRRTNEVWKRHSTSTDSWSPWELQVQYTAVLPTNFVTADNGLNSYPAKKISYCKITGSNTTGIPGEKAGILTTNRVVDDSYYAYQEYEQTEYPYDKYKRNWRQGSTSWSTWKKYIFE